MWTTKDAARAMLLVIFLLAVTLYIDQFVP